MKTLSLLILSCSFFAVTVSRSQQLPNRAETLRTVVSVNNYFMQKYADYSAPSNVGRERPSHIWTRGVYYEGLMALYAISPRQAYYDYAINWANFHKWGLNNQSSTRNADDQCCGQTYVDLYRISPQSEKIAAIKSCMEMLINTPQVGDWTWIDAIQMGMPIFAKLGTTLNDKRYYDKMWKMYCFTRNDIAGRGLYNPKEGLWWRDKDFLPPYKTPNGKNCYWSRGNGWVYAALARVITEIPADEKHRSDYLNDFIAMSKALIKCQQPDGYWYTSLHDAGDFGGKEVTGTSLFVYGMAWGINQGILKRSEYLPVLLKAWNAMAKEAVHPNGFLGYVQGTGKQPSDGQPVTYDHQPDFEDYGIGCFLLAGTEVYKLEE